MINGFNDYCCCCSGCFTFLLYCWLFFGFFSFMGSYNMAVSEGVMTIKASSYIWTLITFMLISLVLNILFRGDIAYLVATVISIICITLSAKIRKSFMNVKKVTPSVNECVKWSSIFCVCYTIDLIANISDLFVSFLNISVK